MQSRWLLNTVKSAMTPTREPPTSSLVAQELLPATSGHPKYEEAHLMPKRFLSRSASAERASPCPLSQMIWAMVQPAGWPYSSWHSSAVSTISTVTYGGSPSRDDLDAASSQNPKTALASWDTASAARTKHSAPARAPARGPAADAAAAPSALLAPSFAAAPDAAREASPGPA